MMAETATTVPATTEAGKTERKRARPPAAEGINAAPIPQPGEAKIKTTMELRHDVHERLHLHAWKLGRSHADLVSELIETHLRRFAVQDRGGAGGEAA